MPSSSSLDRPLIAVITLAVGAMMGAVWKFRQKKQKSKLPLKKENVLELRKKHFLKSVSVSYANSGPLMIVSVSFKLG